MDPNANLAEQAQLVDVQDRDDIARRRGLRISLREWTLNGGYPPDWSAFPAASLAYRRWLRQSAKFQDLAR